jgi:hypothetical protein
VTLAGAERIVRDARYGMHGFRMRQPLAPGARAELAYRVEAAQRGIRTSGFDLSVNGNGSFLTHLRAFPSVGYRGSYEVGDPAERRRQRLPDAESSRATGMAESLEGAAGDWVSFETTVSTSADQVAVAPGELLRTWSRGGRRYFHYAADRPMGKQFAYVSARYAVRRARQGGVTVEVYFHPGHAGNVDRMLRAATASLDEFGRAFGAYPHHTLRIVEVPPYWGFGALALPGVIYWSEDRGFLTDARDSTALDLVTRRVAHEVGHQWWAHQVNPGDGPGASFVNESLAKYSEQMVLRRLRGEPQVTRLMELDLQRYLLGRAQEKEPERPLDQVTDQAWLYYGKGGVVMGALRDLMGEAALNRALHGFVAEHAWPRPAPTSRDLVAALKAEARPEQHALIDQWVSGVATYDLAVEAARYDSLPDGRFRVTARVRARKTIRRGAADVPLAMDEMLDVAAFGEDPRGSEQAPLHAAKHRIRGGAAEVSFVVGRRPAWVAIDPFVHRVEAERADNVRAVTRGGR